MHIFLLIFATVYSSIRPYSTELPLSVVSSVSANTVILLEAKWYSYNKLTSKWQELKTVPWKTSYSIFASTENNWETIYEKFELQGEYEKEGPKSNVLFTAPKSTYYLFQIEHAKEDFEDNQQYGIRINLYKGRQGDPSILSQADTQIREVAKNVEHARDVSREILDNLVQEYSVDALYKSRISKLGYIVFFSAFLKLVLSFVSFYYFNKVLCSHYISKRIAGK